MPDTENVTNVTPGSLAAALVQLQAELPNVTRGSSADTGKYTYRYADYAAILADIRPLLVKHGFAWSCQPGLNPDGQFVLHYRLMYPATDAELSGDYPLPQNLPAQARGSEITYARRYCLTAVLDIALEDDDGKAATDAWQPPANPRTRKADRHQAARSGPLPDDDWTGADPDSIPVTEGRKKELGYWYTQAGITGSKDRLAYAMSKLDRPDLTTSDDLSEADAVRLLGHLKEDAR